MFSIRSDNPVYCKSLTLYPNTYPNLVYIAELPLCSWSTAAKKGLFYEINIHSLLKADIRLLFYSY